MQQAQQMQAKLAKIQEELATMEFEGTSGGGAVRATTTGAGVLSKLEISQDVLREGDAELVSDMVMAAVNSALENGRKHSQQKLGALTGGLGIPGF